MDQQELACMNLAVGNGGRAGISVQDIIAVLLMSKRIEWGRMF